MGFRNQWAPLDGQIQIQLARLKWTVRDLAAWLEQPYSAVWQWVQGTTPRTVSYDDVLERLDDLRHLKREDFDLDGLKGRKRQNKIKKVYRDARRGSNAGKSAYLA